MNNNYFKVCCITDLEDNLAKSFEVNGQSILVARYNDEVYAFENRCTHEDYALGEQKIVQREIQCPRHGARFDIKTGRAVQIPAVVDIKTYDVKFENDEIMVAL